MELDTQELDIHSRLPWPLGALSNFAKHEFVIDGVECASMEGFLQALTHEDIKEQSMICRMHGYAAKRKANKMWKKDLVLHWQGQQYPRKSREYQQLLDRAYDALAENKNFQKALLATGTAKLTHAVGKSSRSETILTKGEFTSRLTQIRARLQKPTLF